MLWQNCCYIGLIKFTFYVKMSTFFWWKIKKIFKISCEILRSASSEYIYGWCFQLLLGEFPYLINKSQAFVSTNIFNFPEILKMFPNVSTSSKLENFNYKDHVQSSLSISSSSRWNCTWYPILSFIWMKCFSFSQICFLSIIGIFSCEKRIYGSSPTLIEDNWNFF